MNESTGVLLHIFVVLVAAKAAGEIAERFRMPVVVAEIAAGALIGPSVLGLVGHDDVLRVLGEIGIILLLLEVGLQMEIGDLVKVGPSSLLVATIGVVAPFAGGYATGIAFGETARTAVFLGAALTATSVGITARVFSELRVLGRIESRTVLGAAVADDVLGLVILTVVLGVAAGGAMSALGVARVVIVAVGFLVIASFLGLRLAPGLFRTVHAQALSPGTYTAVSLAFAIGLSLIAGLAGLAPIVGAFVAGLSLGGTGHAGRVRSALAPAGHLFIPVFFLQIGIDARVQELIRPAVLGLGGALLAVAVAGKLLSSLGSLDRAADKLLIGLGMIPRGEVGLIFAGLGLRHGLLGPDLYAALLFVILTTTLVTPPLLRRRLARPSVVVPVGGERASPGDWLVVERDHIELAGMPPPHVDALQLALRAALKVGEVRPGPRLLDWLSSLDRRALIWSDKARVLFFEVLREGNPRSWRFLEVSAVLDRALPELAEAVGRRTSDITELDPTATLRWALVDRIQSPAGPDLPARVELARLEHPERLLLAALVLDTVGSHPHEVTVKVARKLAQRLDMGAAAEQDIALLVKSAGLMRAAATTIDRPGEEAILRVAAHLENGERARSLYLLSVAAHELGGTERKALDEVHRLVQASMDAPGLTTRSTLNLVERKRAEASRVAGLSKAAVRRALAAPRPYVIATEAELVGRHASLLEPLPERGDVRVDIAAFTPRSWRIDIAARDRPGLLANTTGVLQRAELDVQSAIVATWEDGGAIQSFVVEGDGSPVATKLSEDLRAALAGPLQASSVADARLSFDNDMSPWYTCCEVRASNRPGLLHSLASALASSRIDIHSATVATDAGVAVDAFELTYLGEKLDHATIERLEGELRGTLRRRRPVARGLRERFHQRRITRAGHRYEREATADA
jgi:Kef-type K+ transport system membrane component KefB